MVGREEELGELQRYLQKAAKGKGSTVLISGEAGIGKTRLIEELRHIAESQGFQVLVGYSLHESLTPYMPFLDALRSGGLETLFAEEAPKVEAVYLITHGGMLIKDVLREETELDPDIFASMLTAVGNFVIESMSKLSREEKEGTLRGLSVSGYEILLETGKSANLVAVITGKKNEFLIEDMRGILYDVHGAYGQTLKSWVGDERSVEGIDKILERLITSGKYDGIFYGEEDPKTKRNLFFENVSLGLVRHAQSTPIMMCLEDIQWADPSSLALMHYVARNARECGLLVLGTYRPEEVAATDGMGHPLRSTMQLMDREDLYRMVELHRLPQETMDDFMSAILGQVDFDKKFIDRIYRETEGNPLFIMQLVRLLVDEGIIGRDNGTWRIVRNLDKALIPSKIQSVIARRLDRVEAEVRKVLDYASVIGQIFASTILADAMRLDRIQLLERLRSLERTHTLIHTMNGSYRFDHSKIREVLYEEIPKELRMEYHSIVANSIEQLNKDNLEDVIGDLAFHYYQCKNSEKALRFLLKAAEDAKKEYSNEEAVRFYTQALEFEEDRRIKRQILETIGDVYELIDKHDRALDYYGQALELAEGKEAPVLKAKIGGIHGKKDDYDEALKCCNEALDALAGEMCWESAFALEKIGWIQWSKGEFDEALKNHWRSLEMRRELNDSGGAATSLSGLGMTYYRRGEYEKALEYHKESLETREQLSDQEGIAKSLNNLANVYSEIGRADEALEHYQRSMEINEKIGSPFGVGACLVNMGPIWGNKGDIDKALDCYERASSMFQKIGSDVGLSTCYNQIGVVNLNRGEYERALKNLERSLSISERIDDKYGVSISLHNIGNVHEKMMHLDKAMDYHRRSLAIRKEMGDQWGIAASMNSIGRVHHLGGEYEKALSHYRESLAIYEKLGERGMIFNSHWYLAETYIEMGELEKAMDFSNRSLELAEESVNAFHRAVAHRLLGMINRDQRNWEDSKTHFRLSIEGLKDDHHIRQLANTYREYGFMWKSMGDSEKARENLGKALEIFERLNLEWKAEKVRSALESLEG